MNGTRPEGIKEEERREREKTCEDLLEGLCDSCAISCGCFNKGRDGIFLCQRDAFLEFHFSLREIIKIALSSAQHNTVSE